MATVDKDFKVKNGLVVTNGGSFGGTVTVGTPTSGSHAVTKDYVDSLTGGMPIGPTPPSSPSNGQLWFDTLTERVNVFFADTWMTIATIDDTLNLPQHIHDTAIDGTGFIVSQFYDGASFNSPQGSGLDAGGPTTTEWTIVFDGGTAIDNFN